LFLLVPLIVPTLVLGILSILPALVASLYLARFSLIILPPLYTRLGRGLPPLIPEPVLDGCLVVFRREVG